MHHSRDTKIKGHVVGKCVSVCVDGFAFGGIDRGKFELVRTVCTNYLLGGEATWGYDSNVTRGV